MAGAAAEAGSSLAPQQPLHSSLPQEAFSGQLAEAPGVAHCHLINSNAAAVPGTTPDVNGEDVKCSSQAETDSPCNAAVSVVCVLTSCALASKTFPPK